MRRDFRDDIFRHIHCDADSTILINLTLRNVIDVKDLPHTPSIINRGFQHKFSAMVQGSRSRQQLTQILMTDERLRFEVHIVAIHNKTNVVSLFRHVKRTNTELTWCDLSMSKGCQHPRV